MAQKNFGTKYLQILLLLTIHAAFAQDNPCKDETKKAEILYDMCVKFDPQSQNYMDCAKLFIEQKAKASEICNAASPVIAPAPAASPVPAVVAPPAPWQTPAPAVAPAPVVVPVPTATSAPVATPAPVAALSPVSLAQALSGSGLSGGCVDDFANILKKDGFSMANFVKELPPAVAKVKLQMKSPFGKPKDGDVTSVGLTVGCIKSLPESPAEIQGLLKNIALKAGLDFAMDAAANLADNSIPANVPAEGGSGGSALKTTMSIILIGGGLSTLLYGYMQDNKVSSSIKKRDVKAAVEARDNRNMGYGIGAGLLAVGLGVVIIF